MNKKLLTGIIILLVIAGFGLIALDTMIERADWSLMSETSSPDGNYTIYEYSYRSDGDQHAPYGTYVFLKQSYSYTNPIDSYLIFAGYCSNKNIYKWASNKQIDITCEASEKDNIRTQSIKTYGIKINMITHESQPELSAALGQS